jgi:hypothetical protein
VETVSVTVRADDMDTFAWIDEQTKRPRPGST